MFSSPISESARYSKIGQQSRVISLNAGFCREFRSSSDRNWPNLVCWTKKTKSSTRYAGAKSRALLLDLAGGASRGNAVILYVAQNVAQRFTSL